MSEAIERRLNELRDIARKYAKAEGERTRLEHFRRSQRAILMKKYGRVLGDDNRPLYATTAAQEREAEADPEYIAVINGLAVATEEAERLRWELKIAELGAGVWQTQMANQRAERRAYGA